MEINLTGIPQELKKYPNWVNWTLEEREGKLTKIPLNPHTGRQAQSNNPSTWGTFAQALQTWKECENDRIDGIGFVPTNGYIGVDLDHCRDPESGRVEPWANEIISNLNSYAEVTPSGAGVRVWVEGTLSEHGRKKGNIEMYATGRFFTVTGQHLEGTPFEIHHREEELRAIHKQVFGNEKKTSQKSKSKDSLSISDGDLINKAMNAANGGKFRQLWEGNSSDYPSPSEADLALCMLLAFWTRRNSGKIDTLFRQSGLMREKWDEKHFGNGRTYGQSTIQKAIDETTETYSPQNESQKKEDDTKEKLSYLSLNLPSSLEISELEIKVDWVVKNLIPKESITLLHSIGGVGKSYLMYGIAKAVADGQLFFSLDVMRLPVYYIDFENPLPEIADRMKKMGGSENLRIWHLSHDPAPIRFDADEWEIYKSFPPGLFIIDSLRSSHLMEENSSKDASFIMARHKEIRARGNTIILIHHENRVGGYRGSSAWFDLSDHILKFSRVKKLGSDEDAEEDDLNLPIRLGLGGKSRFSSALDFSPMYLKFENHQLCSADDPEEGVLRKMADLLEPINPPNQSEFRKLAKDNLELKRKTFDRLLRKGEERNLWYSKRSRDRNKLVYLRRESGEI